MPPSPPLPMTLMPPPPGRCRPGSRLGNPAAPVTGRAQVGPWQATRLRGTDQGGQAARQTLSGSGNPRRRPCRRRHRRAGEPASGGKALPRWNLPVRQGRNPVVAGTSRRNHAVRSLGGAGRNAMRRSPVPVCTDPAPVVAHRASREQRSPNSPTRNLQRFRYEILDLERGGPARQDVHGRLSVPGGLGED